MHCVYLLLRDNKQTGPYTLEQLLKMNLKPVDLIWVEGKSCGWSYPSEIRELKFFPSESLENIAKTKAELRAVPEEVIPKILYNESVHLEERKDPRKVHVSLPSKVLNSSYNKPEISPAELLEQKAEELRKRAQSFNAQKEPVQSENLVETKFSRSLNDVEEEYASWVYKQKVVKKKRPVKHWILTTVLIIILTSSYFFVKQYFNDPELTVTKLEKGKEDLQTNKPQVLAGKEPNTDTGGVNNSLIAEKESVEIFTEKKKIPKKPLARKQMAQTGTVEPEPNAPQSIISEVVEPPIVNTSTAKPDMEVSPDVKKKTLGQKIDGFFGKLRMNKKANGEKDLPPKPSNNTQRNSTHRDGEKAAETNLANFISISSNEKSANWMMGVQGLRITLQNKSNHTIDRATVEVRYYNDQNELLEKKNVYFSDIPSKKSVVAAAPDHRLADHADYHLLNAIGKHKEYIK